MSVRSGNEGISYIIGRKEIREISFMLEEQDEEETENTKSSRKLVNERAASCLKWYIHKACSYRIMFYICSVVTLCAPLASSIIVSFNTYNNNSNVVFQIITISLGVISSAATGILALFHAQEKWTRYRAASEYLKRELALYKAGVDKYSTDNAHHLFLKNIEEYMMNENLEWKDNQKPDASKNN